MPAVQKQKGHFNSCVVTGVARLNKKVTQLQVSHLPADQGTLQTQIKEGTQ